MKTAFRISWRFLTSSRGQTLLIVLGIAIGVSVQVFIGSLIAGLQKSLVATTIGSSSQITLKPQERGGLITGQEALIRQLSGVAGLRHISPAADAAGFITVGEETYPVLARGFSFHQAEGIYKLEAALQEGSLPGEGEIMLGRELMREADIRVGDVLTLRTPLGAALEVRVSGQYDLKVASLNRSWAIAGISLVQGLFGYGEGVTAIEMQLDDPFAADTLSASLSGILPGGLKTENWKEANASLLSGLNGQSVSSLMIQVFVMVSVVLGIASVLAISVMQKSRQLGILKAMGIKDRTASLIFLFQGFLLGVLGAILGVALGLGLALAFTKFAVRPDGSPVVALFIDPQFIALSGLIALLASTLAALVPARRSSKLDPMEVIRNG
ncbi:MAG: ABC transporter permease [Christensenellales bacterium]